MATIERELVICVPCALQFANGGCDGCTSCAFGDDECGRRGDAIEANLGTDSAAVAVGDEIPGYAPIFTCDACGWDNEGEQYTAVIIK